MIFINKKQHKRGRDCESMSKDSAQAQKPVTFHIQNTSGYENGIMWCCYPLDKWRHASLHSGSYSSLLPRHSGSQYRKNKKRIKGCAAKWEKTFCNWVCRHKPRFKACRILVAETNFGKFVWTKRPLMVHLWRKRTPTLAVAAAVRYPADRTGHGVFTRLHECRYWLQSVENITWGADSAVSRHLVWLSRQKIKR